MVSAVDNDPVACRTYRLNHRRVRLIEDDIRNIRPEAPLDDSGRSEQLDLLVICAPCQPFSSQNRKKTNDDRATLLLEALKFAEEISPWCVFVENVPGIASSTILRDFRQRLTGAGYFISRPRTINAADFGVPQRRVRCVMVACKSEAGVRLFEDYSPKLERSTVRMAIGKLRQLRAGESDPNDALHAARQHQALALERLMHIQHDGGGRKDLPDRLRLKCHKDDKSFSDVYGRMRWDDLAPTLTTGCDDVTKGRFAHPEQDRAITLREAALLQTFSPTYRFSGNRSDIARQIGNAVPVAMVEGLVPVLKRIIREGRKNRHTRKPIKTAARG